MHLRQPEQGGPRKAHQFRYSVFRLLLDLDQLDETAKRLSFFSVNRWNLLSLRPSDHGAEDGSDLRGWADAELAGAGIEKPARVLLYTFPRVAGYVFNPLSVYFCLDHEDALTAVIYEVRNTVGDLHPYVVPIRAENGIIPNHGTEKLFYVSPFISEAQRYTFSLNQQEADLALRIRVDGEQGLTLIATENTEGATLTDGRIMMACLRFPFMTAKIIAGIYFEAVRLRLKGAKMYDHPGKGGVYNQSDTASEKVDLFS